MVLFPSASVEREKAPRSRLVPADERSSSPEILLSLSVPALALKVGAEKVGSCPIAGGMSETLNDCEKAGALFP